MTSYLEAKVVPLVSSSEAFFRKLVGDAEISSGEGSGVAHLPQKLLSSGFSK
jgi:hypothetical protein